jgi:hypothetical protein
MINSLHVISKVGIRNSLLKFKCAHPYFLQGPEPTHPAARKDVEEDFFQGL